MVAIVPPNAVVDPPTAATADAVVYGKPAETNMERLQQVRRRVAKAVHDEIQGTAHPRSGRYFFTFSWLTQSNATPSSNSPANAVVETAIKNDIKMVLGRIEAAEEFMRFNEFIQYGL